MCAPRSTTPAAAWRQPQRSRGGGGLRCQCRGVLLSSLGAPEEEEEEAPEEDQKHGRRRAHGHRALVAAAAAAAPHHGQQALVAAAGAAAAAPHDPQAPVPVAAGAVKLEAQSASFTTRVPTRGYSPGQEEDPRRGTRRWTRGCVWTRALTRCQTMPAHGCRGRSPGTRTVRQALALRALGERAPAPQSGQGAAAAGAAANCGVRSASSTTRAPTQGRTRAAAPAPWTRMAPPGIPTSAR